jgi:hypothetical protein
MPSGCYGDNFTFLYVDVSTSQKTHLWASTACYGDSVTLREKHASSEVTENVLRKLYGLLKMGKQRIKEII